MYRPLIRPHRAPARLAAALTVFKDLGWHTVTRPSAGWDPEQVLALPLGTPAQRATARQGLSGGAWGGWADDGEQDVRELALPDTVASVVWHDVDPDLLVAFAVRQGVPASRARVLMSGLVEGASVGWYEERPREVDLHTALVVSRGPAFVRAFVRAAAAASTRTSGTRVSDEALLLVRLVADHQLEIPDELGYLADWTALAATAWWQLSQADQRELGVQVVDDLGVNPEPAGGARAVPLAPADVTRLLDRAGEHAAAATRGGVSGRGELPHLLITLQRQGILDRATVVDLVGQAIDVSQRPAERAAWVRFLVASAGPASPNAPEDRGGLEATDAELVEHLPALHSALLAGDPAILGRLLPRVIGHLDEDDLAVLGPLGLQARTRSTRVGTVRALATLPPPRGEALATVLPLLRQLADSPDALEAVPTGELLDGWGLAAEQLPVGDPTAGEPEGHGSREQEPAARWAPTPPVWELPRFHPGEVSFAAWDEAVSAWAGDRWGTSAWGDLWAERCWYLAHALAGQDRERLRVLVRERMRRTGGAPGWALRLWAADDLGALGEAYELELPDQEDLADPLEARALALLQRLGDGPGLLSLPSLVDLTITPADLADRLAAWHGTPIDAPDLVCALQRLDLAGCDEAAIDRIATASATVVWNGSTVVEHVGSWLSTVLRDRERPRGRTDSPLRPLARVPAAGAVLGLFELHSVDPSFTPPLPGSFQRWAQTGNSSQVLAHLVRRGEPLASGDLSRVLEALRGPDPETARATADQVVLAWERGLVRPEAVDLSTFRADGNGIERWAARMQELAEQGLASVAWVALDSWLALSARQGRVLNGTEAVVRAVEELLPSSPPAERNLPGLRAVAARTGASRGVLLARALVERLDAVANPE